VPDVRSIQAGEQCLEVAARAPSLLVCISGGASSLVCVPSDGVTLRMKQHVTRALLASGAPIADVNVVRKHLSLIKGGGLSRAAGEAPVFTLIMSDVVRGQLSDVGSGPTLPDATTVDDAKKIVKKWLPGTDFASLPFAETGDVPNSVEAKIVVAPSDLARAMSSRLKHKGYTVVVRKPTQAPVERVAKDILATAKRLRPGQAAIGVGEPSLKVPEGTRGRGGRSTHLAALVGKALPPGYLFGAFATDGVDGASNTAGAIVDGAFAERVGVEAIDRAIAAYDTGTLHASAGTAMMEAPTGQNLADLHVILRLP
jgi:hydroxypyruvate reductase